MPMIDASKPYSIKSWPHSSARKRRNIADTLTMLDLEHGSSGGGVPSPRLRSLRQPRLQRGEVGCHLRTDCVDREDRAGCDDDSQQAVLNQVLTRILEN